MKTIHDHLQDMQISAGNGCNGTKRPEVSKAEREHTPPELAAWLVELARRCVNVGVTA